MLASIEDVGAAGVVRLEALVGSRTGRVLAEILLAELAIIPGWGEVPDTPSAAPFWLRNIVSAQTYLESRYPSYATSVLEGSKRRKVRDVALHELRKTHDVGSAIARVQTIARLSATVGMKRDVHQVLDRHLSDSSSDVRVQARMTRHALDLEPVPNELFQESIGILGDHSTTLAAVIRICDGLVAASEANLLPGPALCQNLAGALVDALQRFQYDAETGWSSIEATATIQLGLVSLIKGGAQRTGRTISLLGKTSKTLNVAVESYERRTHGVGLLARVVHALVLTEANNAVGFERLALPTAVVQGGKSRLGAPNVVAI